MTAFAWLCIGICFGVFIGWHHGYMRRLREDRQERLEEHDRQMRLTRCERNIVRGL